MQNLIHTIDSIDRFYSIKRRFLFYQKLSFIGVISIGIIYALLRMLPTAIFKYKLSLTEIIITDSFVFLILMLPIIFSPIHQFASDKVFKRMTRKIKSSIINKIASNYSSSYTVYPKLCISEKEIINAGFPIKTFDFVYGDDLIVGHMTNLKFILSEVHVYNPLLRKFDGIICKVIFKNTISEEIIQKAHNDLKSTQSFLLSSENQMYIFSKGKKSHFEMDIKRNKIAQNHLIEDYKILDETFQVIKILSNLAESSNEKNFKRISR